MRIRKCVTVGALIASAFVIYFSLPLECRWSLTTDRMTVFVCDSSGLEGTECSWSGSQQFVINHKDVRAKIRVMVFDNEQILSVLIQAVEASQIESDSIAIHLTGKDSDGNNRDIHLVQRLPTALSKMDKNGSIQSWFQEFQIVEDLLVLTEGTLALNWSMKYHESNDHVKTLSVTIPLRRETITIPSSIVKKKQNSTSYFALVGCEAWQ